MGNTNSNLVKMWELFAETGEIDPSVRAEIADSWRRCKEYNVSSYVVSGIAVNELQFQEAYKKNKDLIALAKPIMEYFCEALLGLDAVISLSDENALILEMMGSKKLIERFGKSGFRKGVQWKESVVGTNSLDLCLILDRPVQTNGAEQYCREHHQATGSGAPIHNEKGDIIGSINITSDMEIFSKYSLGMVTMGAKVIENQIALLDARFRLQNGFNSIKENIIMTDSERRINFVNRKVCDMFNLEEEELIGIDINELLEEADFNFLGDYIRFDGSIVVGRDKMNCRGYINKTIFNEDITGYIIIFNDEKVANRLINKQIGNIAKYTFDDIITEDDSMIAVINESKQIAKSDYSVLIMGETGTGKELLAQSIHNASERARGPFVAINCAAMPRELVESELFGYESGSFTGAKKTGYSGKFEMANGGTIFLDEIGEMPIEIQAKLLRVLDNHSIMRIGGELERQLDVRVLAATNLDLEKEICDQNFRPDLFYRLNEVTLRIPSLNERPKDIRVLAEYFIRKKAKADEPLFEITDDFIEILEAHEWQGNVRELQNAMSKAAYHSGQGKDSLLDFLYRQYGYKEHFSHGNPKDERSVVICAIRQADGNITKAASLMGISKATIYRKMKALGIKVKKEI